MNLQHPQRIAPAIETSPRPKAILKLFDAQHPQRIAPAIETLSPRYQRRQCRGSTPKESPLRLKLKVGCCIGGMPSSSTPKESPLRLKLSSGLARQPPYPSSTPKESPLRLKLERVHFP